MGPTTKASVIAGADKLATEMEGFLVNTDSYLTSLASDNYRDDSGYAGRDHHELSRLLGRLNLLRLDLIELGRKLKD